MFHVKHGCFCRVMRLFQKDFQPDNNAGAAVGERRPNWGVTARPGLPHPAKPLNRIFPALIKSGMVRDLLVLLAGAAGALALMWLRGMPRRLPAKHSRLAQLWWRWKSRRRGRGGRPPIDEALIELIRRMNLENPVGAHRAFTANSPNWDYAWLSRPCPAT